MGLNISNVAVNYNSGASAIQITNNSNVYGWRNDGIILSPNTPMFTAGITSSTANPAFVLTISTWTKLVFTAVLNNVGNCFASNTFTAPVTGSYYFSMNSYISGSVANTQYVHPGFFVNGGYAGRRNGQGRYRMRLHGRPASSTDVLCSEILSLTAGDYVEAYIIAGGSQVTLTPYYNQFSGIFLG